MKGNKEKMKRSLDDEQLLKTSGGRKDGAKDIAPNTKVSLPNGYIPTVDYGFPNPRIDPSQISGYPQKNTR